MVAPEKLLGYGASALVLLWTSPALSSADGDDTLQPFVAETVSYDDNLFRLTDKADPERFLPAGSSKTDVINQLSVGGKIHYALSRQTFLIDLRVDDNRFLNNEDLNNISTKDLATWKWVLGSQLSGNLGYGYERSLGSFAYNQTFRKDIISENEAFFDLNYAWHPRWKLTAGARWHESTHSNKARALLDRESATGQIGLNYVTPSNNSIGVEYKFTAVDLPNRQPSPIELIDNRYQVQTISAILAWNFTERMRLDGKFGYTSLQNDQFDERDFGGETWRLNLAWAPTAKTQLTLAGWRELQPSQLVFASYVVSKGVSLTPAWSPTAKLTVEAKLSYDDRAYAGDPGLFPGLAARHDELLSGQLAVIYAALRNTEINLAYVAEQRDSTQKFWSYSDNSVFASAKLKF